MIPALPPTEDPERIGKYRIVGFCGEGGVGAVYRAEDDFLRRTVAVKVLRPEHRVDPMHRARFLQEVLIGAKLAHPNIAAVFDGGEIRRARGDDEATEPAAAAPRLDGVALADGTLYFVQEFLQGPTLSQHLRAHGPLPYREVPARLGGVFEAVAYMHGRGVIHRDLKPGNIHFGDVVKVLDLGSAKVGDEVIGSFAGVERTAGAPPLTRAYLSPEAFEQPLRNDPYLDLWALAGTVYQAVTGRLPFGSGSDENLPATYRRIIEGRYTPLRELDPDVPAAVEAFFARAFALQREARYPSVEAMYEAARDAFAEGRRLPASPGAAREAAAPTPLAASALPTPGDGAGPSVASRPSAADATQVARGRSGAVATVAAVVGVAAVTALILLFVRSPRSRREEPATPSDTSSVELLVVPAVGSTTDAAVVASMDATTRFDVEVRASGRSGEVDDAAPLRQSHPLNPQRPFVPPQGTLAPGTAAPPVREVPAPLPEPRERPPQPPSPPDQRADDPCSGPDAPC